MILRLERVQYVPRELEAGVLYVSEEFGTAAHLCPCGCRMKVRTPLGPTEWEFVDDDEGPTLYPSIGNWQHECQSHYWIRRGRVEWAAAWTPEQIQAGRRQEERRRSEYYEGVREPSILGRIWRTLVRWFTRG